MDLEGTPQGKTELTMFEIIGGPRGNPTRKDRAHHVEGTRQGETELEIIRGPRGNPTRRDRAHHV